MTRKLYLYKKTHRITGLQYLGKTVSTDPHSYPGSGVYWTRHLTIHGNDVYTEILRECYSESELIEWGLYYSKLWNIVESKEWANLTEEAGPGGAWSIESRQKLSQTKKRELSTLSPEEHRQRMKKSCSSPESWSTERRQKISQALTGIKRSDITKEKIKQANATRIFDVKKCGDANRGKTWKLVDGKRVWITKETQ